MCVLSASVKKGKANKHVALGVIFVWAVNCTYTYEGAGLQVLEPV